MENIINKLDEIKQLLLFQAKEVFTLEEFSKYAGISMHTAYKYTSQRRFRFYRVGKSIYISRNDTIAFLLSHPVNSAETIENSSVNMLNPKHK